MTIGKSWAYNPHETAWKDPGRLVGNLVEVVSRGDRLYLHIFQWPAGQPLEIQPFPGAVRDVRS